VSLLKPPADPIPHMGAVEWTLVKLGRTGVVEARHSEGAQSVFGIGRARKILKELGAGWVIRHYQESWRAPTAED
jgi:hypothetical protein